MATISIISLLKPRNIETNLLRAFLINNEKNETLIELSGKYSANINILFESNTPDQLEKTKEEFLNQIDQSIFEIQSANFEKTLDFYKKYKNNLLAYNDYLIMKNGDFETITQQAVDNLYNPFSFSLLPENEDPFMLFTNYITSLNNGNFSSNSSQNFCHSGKRWLCRCCHIFINCK